MYRENLICNSVRGSDLGTDGVSWVGSTLLGLVS